MSWSPLGTWNPKAPLDEVAYAAARKWQPSLPKADKGELSRGYFHWTGTAYNCTFTEYNAEIELENNLWVIKTTHSPLDNAESTFSDANYAAGTYHRNKGAVAVAVAAMGGTASPSDFGPTKVQFHEIEHMAAAMAALCKTYEIDSLGTSASGGFFSGEPNLLTHCEAAWRSGYPPQYEPYSIMDRPSDGVIRWDFLSLVPLPKGLQPQKWMATTVGNALRQRTHLYGVALR